MIIILTSILILILIVQMIGKRLHSGMLSIAEENTVDLLYKRPTPRRNK